MRGKSSQQEPASHFPLHGHPSPRTTFCKVSLGVFQRGFSRALCCCPQRGHPAGQSRCLHPSTQSSSALSRCGSGRTFWKAWGDKGNLWEALQSVFEEGSSWEWCQSPAEGLREPWGHTGRVSGAMTGVRPCPQGAAGPGFW